MKPAIIQLRDVGSEITMIINGVFQWLGDQVDKNISTYENGSFYLDNLAKMLKPSQHDVYILVQVTLVGVLAMFVSQAIKKIRRHISLEKYNNLPPGDMGHPFLGETIAFLKGSLDGTFFRDRSGRYGPIFKTMIFGCPTIYISDKLSVTKTLYEEGKSIEAAWPPAMRFLLGPRGLSSQGGLGHRRLKVQLMKAMNSYTLRDLSPILQHELSKELLSLSESTEPVDIRKRAKQITTRLACLFLFGCSVDDPGDISAKLSLISDGFFSLPVPLPGTTFYKAWKAKKVIVAFIKASVAQHQKAQDGWVSGFIPVIPGMIKAAEKQLSPGQGYMPAQDNLTHMANYEDIALELLLGGHETITSAITSLYLYMDKHQSAVTAITDELKKLNEENISYSEIGKLTEVGKVVEAAITEYPPISGAYKKVNKEMIFEKYHVPKDWRVICSMSCSSSESKTVALPFGAGPRSCVGKIYAKLVLKIFIIELVQKHHFIIHKPYPTMIYVPSLRPVTPMLVTQKLKDTHLAKPASLPIFANINND